MEQQKDNTQENDNTIKTSIIQDNNTLIEQENKTITLNKFSCVNINDCNTYNSLCNSENVNDLIRESIKESENETIKEEIEQANENINLLFLSKPKSKKAQSEINKLIEGLK